MNKNYQYALTSAMNKLESADHLLALGRYKEADMLITLAELDLKGLIADE